MRSTLERGSRKCKNMWQVGGWLRNEQKSDVFCELSLSYYSIETFWIFYWRILRAQRWHILFLRFIAVIYLCCFPVGVSGNCEVHRSERDADTQTDGHVVGVGLKSSDVGTQTAADEVMAVLRRSDVGTQTVADEVSALLKSSDVDTQTAGKEFGVSPKRSDGQRTGLRNLRTRMPSPPRREQGFLIP